MSRVENLVGVAPNAIAWTENHGLVQLNGRLRAPFTDNRNLLPPEQMWDLVLNMFEVAQERFRNDHRRRYVLRLGFGISGANRYSYSMKGRIRDTPEASTFFDRIERMIDSNDTLDIRDIRLLMDFIAQ